MSAAVEISDANVIALGSFAPALFSPDWLERHQLIGSEDAAHARETSGFLVSNQVAQFETEWFKLQVIDDQFSLESRGPVGPTLRDLAIGIFANLQMAVRALGINFMVHYKFAKVDDYHHVGDVLAPKWIWMDLFPNEHCSAGLTNLTIEIRPHKRDEVPKNPDVKRFTVQPSAKVKNGIFLSFNDHHQIRNDEQALPCEQVVRILNECWDHDWNESSRYFEAIITKALKQQLD